MIGPYIPCQDPAAFVLPYRVNRSLLNQLLANQPDLTLVSMQDGLG